MIHQLQTNEHSVLIRPASEQVKRTYVVLGAPRGGTSMLAGIMRILGIYMGPADQLGHQHEDPAFRMETSLETKLDTIRARSDQHDVWGWKMPNSIHYIEQIEEHIVNPHYVAIYRNPLSIAKSSAQRDGRDFDLNLIDVATNHYAKMNGFLRDNTHPCIAASFESARAKPRAFASELASFCQVTTNQEVLDRCFQFVHRKPGYKRIDRFILAASNRQA